MLTGIRLRAHPKPYQKQILSQWMGSARTIWNAKCEEERYHTRFARRFCPMGTYAPIDQSFSQYKHKTLTPWLFECPSQILRNSAVNWYRTYQKFIKGECGKPKRKHRDGTGSIHLTRELFAFVRGEDGVERLYIGSKRNNIGYLSIKNHTHYQNPKSIYIKKAHGSYTVSFCYDDEMDESALADNQAHLAFLKEASEDYLQRHVVGVDRGVARPVQAGDQVFDYTDQQKAKQKKRTAYIRRQQKRLARQIKGSARRERTKVRLSKAHSKMANIRNDFCHKTSRQLVDQDDAKVLVFEDLRTRQMSARPQPKLHANGYYEKNHARQKAGLNKAILNVGWHKLENYTAYKAYRAGKAFFKVPAHHTSQECAACGHTHPENRQSQSRFHCRSCGYTDHADRNASLVIKKRAIALLTDSGTELSKRGVLRLDTGRGAKRKTCRAIAKHAVGCESSKKKILAANAA